MAAASSSNRAIQYTCHEQAQQYIDKMLSADTGLKVLLVDESTKNAISICYSHKQLLAREVVLVEMLENYDRIQMKHFKCVIICRPVVESVSAIEHELAQSNFSSYRIYFTHFVEPQILKCIANADDGELVVSVEEVFLDTVPVTDHLCIVPMQPSTLSAGNTHLANPIFPEHWEQFGYARAAQGIVSVMLMTKRRPVIRFRSNNKAIEKLAQEVGRLVKQLHSNFADLKCRDCVLVIMDRLDDPVTPLVMQWTYEAMIHEIIGVFDGNKILVEDAGAVTADERTHIMSPETDPFFHEHRYSDYGTMCIAVAKMVETYKAMNDKLDKATASLEDITNFMAKFPEARKESAQVTKHTNIATQLVNDVNSRGLTKISVIEQEIIVSGDITDVSRRVLDIVKDTVVEYDDAIRLAMLYYLRYEKNSSNIMAEIKSELQKRRCPQEKLAQIDDLIAVCGSGYRMHELFKSASSTMLKGFVNSIAQFGGEVQNVLMQHVPVMKKIINRLYNGTLSEKDYPVLHVEGSPVLATAASILRAQDIIVFVAGGTTYEEAMLVDQINRGIVDNNVESMMQLGEKVSLAAVSGGITAIGSTVLNVGAKLGDKLLGNDGVPSQPAGAASAKSSAASFAPQTSADFTAKIEARVVLASTAVLNSRLFLQSLAAPR